LDTLYDWLSVAVFAGLTILFLHRSASKEPKKDSMIMYLPPAAGCVFANLVGNQGEKDHQPLLGYLAIFVLVLVVGYIFHILKPAIIRKPE
jgi:hypothetical protein